MCGIFGVINGNLNEINNIYYSFEIGKDRGPEHSSIEQINNHIFGFHRLAINGLNLKSNQPFKINDCILICNGEIYNYKDLSKELNITLKTESDCEIIIHLYKMFGIEYTLHLLDGVFAFMLYDKILDIIYVSRDPYGVRPLFVGQDKGSILLSSDLKCIYPLIENKNSIYNFNPGYYMVFNNKTNELFNMNKYTYFPFTDNVLSDYDEIYYNIYNSLYNAVKKRVIGTCERPIACLLSGGLDSSLITALVKKFYRSDIKLKTFSIGLKGSEDLKYAKIVADYLDTDHTEVIVKQNDFLNAIPEVVKVIESYDTTTIRASVGNYLIGKYIKNNCDAKVIFNGDGADELMGGYLYMKLADNSYEFDNECKRLLNNIYKYDVLRSDKSISSNGLEPRTPFLDRKWVETYLSINKDIRYSTTKDKCEKYLIRKSFNVLDNKILPECILWRTKEAFSDGVSGQTKSWYEIIQDWVEVKYNENEEIKNEIENMKLYNEKHNNTNKNTPKTTEQCYYKMLYDGFYAGTDHLIPEYWMPKYVDAKDASARTLQIYNNNNTNKKSD